MKKFFYKVYFDANMDILIYSRFDSYSATTFINQVDELIESGSDELTVRINSNGGEPEYGFGMISKFQEFSGSKKVKVDGKAFSMGFGFCCYADYVEALDVSEFLVHRAAYPSWFENEPEYFTEELRSNLERVNVSLKKAIEAKIDVKKFEELKGVKLKDIFSMDSRIDVFLSATDAKKIGLIDKIVKITPSKKAEIDAYMDVPAKAAESSETPKENTNEKPIKMDLNKLKAEHPEVYAQAVAVGVSEEKIRVEAWAEWMEIDAEAAKAGIDSGKAVTMKDVSAFSKKMSAASALSGLEAEGKETPGVQTPEVDANAEVSAVDKFEAELNVKLGINPEKSK